MYHQFNIQQLYALPHTVCMCFCIISEQTATCATYSINWSVFITQMKSVYSAVRTGSLNKAVCASSFRTNSDLCHLQHKLIGFYNPDEKCLQRGTDWVFKYSGLRFVFKVINKPHLSEVDFIKREMWRHIRSWTGWLVSTARDDVLEIHLQARSPALCRSMPASCCSPAN